MTSPSDRGPAKAAANRRYKATAKGLEAHRRSNRTEGDPRKSMLRFFARRRRIDSAGKRPGYTGDVYDKVIDARIRARNERRYDELREANNAGE